MTARVEGIDLARMAKAAAPRARRVTGTLEADVRLATAFGRDPMAALTGGGSFAVRNGTFVGLNIEGSLATLARALQMRVPAGDTRFRYFGGDLRIARQRVYSSALRLDAEELEGTAQGSVGFNRTLDYAGSGVLKNARASTAQSGGLLSDIGKVFGDSAQGVLASVGVRVPFVVKGTVDDPRFFLGGTPEPAGTQGSPARARQTLPEQNLFDQTRMRN